MEHLLENNLPIYLQSQLIRQAVLYFELTSLQLSFIAPSVYLVYLTISMGCLAAISTLNAAMWLGVFQLQNYVAFSRLQQAA